MSFEFPVKKSSDRTSIPPAGMGKAFVKGEIAFIEVFCFNFVGIRPVGRHIENGDVQEINALAVSNGEIKGPVRSVGSLCRGAE